MNTPDKPGLYLALYYLWSGYVHDKPVAPKWGILEFDTDWIKPQVNYDTGFGLTLEVIQWQPLPPI